MATNYFLNQYFTTTLNVGGGIDNSQTTGIIVQAVSGLDITKPGVACITYADPINTSTAEWVTYTSINGSNELQGVTRGAEGFGAKTHSNGATIAFPLSESHINTLATALSIGGVATNGVTSTLDEDDMATNSATALATQQSIKAYVDTSVYRDGWIPAGETWVYASADDPTFTFTVAGVDLTTKYYPGMRIKLTQTTAKYFIITAVTFSTNTTITVYGGTDYDLANEAITLPFYSRDKAPAGFPLSPVKWSVEVVNTANASQASPTTGTWYNLGSITISVPIGVWNTKYQAHLRSEKATITYIDVAGTLSTANNSESDKEWTGYIGANGASGTISAKGAIYRSGVLTLTSKTAYYLNGQVNAISSGTADSVQFRGDLAETVITATSAYL